MQVSEIDYSRLPYWSHTDLAYIQRDPLLAPFYEYAPGFNHLGRVITERKKFPVDRSLLLSSLKKQYAALGNILPVADDMLLNQQTFTITTAHQPVLFTGPLYHIYKIASAIHLSRQCKAEFPDHHFIPVFVIGGEDHDWAEINHYFLFGKKHEWQRAASGPTGRLNLDGLDLMIEEVREKFSHAPYGDELYTLLKKSLTRSATYAQFHQALLIALFQEHGLLVFNMDDPDLKRSFIPLLQKELTEQFSTHYVPATQAQLEQAGFKAQAFCRPINLFYLEDGIRERIEPLDDGGFVRVDTNTRYSEKEMLDLLYQHPERFSPNVILRPLYQEHILPNIAFVGGGGEIAYWLERKTQFEAARIHFPMLIRRNSLLLVDGPNSAQLEKADITWKELIEDIDSVIKAYLLKHSKGDLTYEEEKKWLHEAYARLAEKAQEIDPTLATAILAEESKQSKLFDQLGSRLLRAEKQHQESAINRIRKLKDKLFPEGGLQERHDNMMPFYALYGRDFIRDVVNVCDPMKAAFTTLSW